MTNERTPPSSSTTVTESEAWITFAAACVDANRLGEWNKSNIDLTLFVKRVCEAADKLTEEYKKRFK